MVGDLGGVLLLRLLIELNEARFCNVGVVVLSWLREPLLGVLLIFLVGLAMLGEAAPEVCGLPLLMCAGDEAAELLSNEVCKDNRWKSLAAMPVGLLVDVVCSILSPAHAWIFCTICASCTLKDSALR